MQPSPPTLRSDDLPTLAAPPTTCIGVSHGTPAACLPTLLSALCATSVKQAASTDPRPHWVLLPRADGDGLTRDISPLHREPSVRYIAWTDPRSTLQGLRDTLAVLQDRPSQSQALDRDRTYTQAFFGVTKLAGLREACRLLPSYSLRGMVLYPKLPRLWDAAWCTCRSSDAEGPADLAHFVLLPCASRDDATLLVHHLHLQVTAQGVPGNDATAVAFRNARSLFHALSRAWFGPASAPEPLLLSLQHNDKDTNDTYSLARIAMPVLQPAAKTIHFLRL